MNKENIKKIILIFFIFLIVGLIYFSFKNIFFNFKIFHQTENKQVQIENFEQKIEKEAEEIKKINEDFSKLSPEKKEFIMPKYYKLERSDCNKVKEDVLKEECFSLFDFNDILEKKNISACDNLSSEWKDMCIYKVAMIKKDNWQYCENIIDKYIHDVCLKFYTIELNDVELCKKMNYGYQSCVERVKAINNGWGGDIKNCTDIQKNEYYWMCINMTKQDCGVIEDAYDRDRCTSAVFFGNILQSGEKKDCSILPLETYRKTCEMYFDNNKTHIDFDGDGVDNGMELFSSTNPLVYEKDAKDYEGYETQWGEVFNNVYYKSIEKFKELTIDTDDDGLRDYDEKEIYSTDFEVQDTDGDGLLDGEEVNKYKTDPKSVDTDSDGYDDAEEVKKEYEQFISNDISD